MRSPRLEGTDVTGGEPPAQDLLQVNELFVCLPQPIYIHTIQMQIKTNWNLEYKGHTCVQIYYEVLHTST